MTKSYLSKYLWLFVTTTISLFFPIYSKATVKIEKLPDSKVYSDFVVGPGQMDLSLDPGETKEIEIIISNRLGVNKNFSINKEDVVGSNDINQTTILLGTDKGPYSLKDFIKPEVESINVKHGERARIPVTITIPPNSPPGGMYGSLIVSTISDPAPDQKKEGSIPSNSIITRIAVLIFIKVNGQTLEKGWVSSFSTSNNEKIFFKQKEINFNILFKNEGNVSLRPYGNIDIKNSVGTVIDSIKVDPWFALPNSLRFRQISWEPDFRLGKYTAEATIYRGYNDERDKLIITFWIVPLKIITWFILISFAFLLTFRLWKK